MTSSVIHQAESKLRDSSHHFSRTVRCAFDDGVLKIEGRVPTFYLKQTAQSLIQGIDGVDRVENALIVTSPYGVSSEPTVAAP